MKSLDPGAERFDAIRQMVQVHDRKDYNAWLAAEREQLRAAGLADDGLAYRDKRARTEDDDQDHERSRQRDEKPKPQPIVWDASTGQHYERAAILGDPGFGKSWLLRFEARHLALAQRNALDERTITLSEVVLPLWMRLSDLADTGTSVGEGLIQHFTQDAQFANVHRAQAFRRYFEAQLRSGKVVVLLDALDEVPSAKRARLRAALDTFARRQDAQIRIVITSRLVGYEGLPFERGQELELLPFNPQQITHFVRVWFGDNATGQSTAEALLATLKTRPTLTALARIPLMLTLIARTYQARPHHFPTRRVELYDTCLKGLLRDWNALREQSSEGYVAAILELLAPVAYQLWVRGLEQFRETELREVIGAELRKLDATHELRRRHDASSLIAELKETGILVTVGTGPDAPLLFLHRTFHEYLAACHLARAAEPKPMEDPTGLHPPKPVPRQWTKIAPIVSRKAWLPEWQEVIVLLAGKLDEPGPMLEMLGDPNPTRLNPYGDDVFRHRLGLACLCLSEITPATQGKHPTLINRLATQAMDIWFDNTSRDTHAVVKHLTRAALPGLAQNRVHFFTRLVEQLGDSDVYLRGRAAEALGKLGPAVLAARVERLGHSEWDVRGTAAEALGRLGPAAAMPAVLAALVKRLRDSVRKVRYFAAQALGALGPAATTPADLAILVKQFQHSVWELRRAAAVNLGRLGPAAGTPAVLAALVKRLGDSKGDVRYAAAEALGAIGPAVATPAVLAALVERLGDSARDMWRAAAAALSQWMQSGLRFFSVRPFFFWRRWEARSVSLLAQEDKSLRWLQRVR